MAKYFLKGGWEGAEWQEVSRSEWIKAEREAGFRPKYGGEGPATGGFGGRVHGKIEEEY